MNSAIQTLFPSEPIVIDGMLGYSSQKQVFVGFAPANVLSALSFADVLEEQTGRGYQRRFNPRHSLDFRKYIQTEGAATIPLTFNLRHDADGTWRLLERAGGGATLEVSAGAGKILAQVDCQHRLGHLNDVRISLPFMFFIGLSVQEEMEVFNVINSKAKGLSTSLLDFHDATLAADLGAERPELFVALHLNNISESPWYRQLDLGGNSTSGLSRRASLRTMQKAIRRFLNQSKILQKCTPEVAAAVVLDFWCGVSTVLGEQWSNPRRHLINKGVGVYALMAIAADLFAESEGQTCDKRFFVNKLSEFASDIDWTINGPLRGLGGEGGVNSALALIRTERKKRRLRIISNG